MNPNNTLKFIINSQTSKRELEFRRLFKNSHKHFSGLTSKNNVVKINSYKYIKRCFDIFLAILLLLLLSPLFILTFVSIIVIMGKPVLFSQKRTGLRNKEFEIYKFRSMVERSESRQTDEQRIPELGRLIRIMRIDELPQIWNILLGDMSFIGPRPLLTEYLPYYTDVELRRHEVKPGLSGLSQVSSLYNPVWEEQFKFDIIYVENISFHMDILILLKTIKKIFNPVEMMTTKIGGRVNFVKYRTEQMDKLSKDFSEKKGE